jgi:hypothetical protein
MTDVPADAQLDPETTTEDDGGALDRAAESIHEARDAEGAVAANDDITSLDEERAEVHSEDPGAEGDHS